MTEEMGASIGKLAGCAWTTACKEKPWLMKGGVFEKHYHVLLTNLSDSFYTTADDFTIENEREEFNKSLKTNSPGDFLDLLHRLISENNREAKYLVTEFTYNSDAITLNVSKQLEFYPFKWEFTLFKVPREQHLRILTHQVVGAHMNTIKLMEERFRRLLGAYNQLLKEVDTNKEETIYRDSIGEWELVAKGCEVRGFPSLGESMGEGGRWLLGVAGRGAGACNVSLATSSSKRRGGAHAVRMGEGENGLGGDKRMKREVKEEVKANYLHDHGGDHEDSEEERVRDALMHSKLTHKKDKKDKKKKLDFV